MYENDDYEERRESMLSTLSQWALGVKVNLVYLVFKIWKAWPVLDFIARQTFWVLVISLIALSIHW